MVAFGNITDWPSSEDTAWVERLGTLADVAGRLGVRRVSLVPFAGVRPGAEPLEVVGFGSTVLVADCSTDGRDRIVRAVARLRRGRRVSERRLSRALVGRDGEPDLVIVCGDGTRLPSNLVWELAYSEIVFVDVDFDGFGARHIEEAVDEFRRRNRRFGGVDQ